jgi:myosin heavy subunit
VPYSTNGMAAKNKVSSAGLSMLLPLLTAFPEALELLRSAEQATRRGGAAAASATTFTKLLRDQVDALLTTLKASRCIWVRCIKPNGANAANIFDTRDVKRQLLTAGVLASAGVLAQGLSVRMPIRDFAMRFAAVLDKYPWRELERLQHKKVCEAIGKKVALLMQKRQQREQQQQQQGSSSPPRLSSQQQQQQQAPMQIGLTKVFLNTEAYEELTAATNERLAAYLTAVQQAGRAFRARLDVADLLRVAVRRRLAHELSLRIEEERPRREALEVERCLDEERSAAAMAAVRPRSAQLGREAGTALGQRTKQFLDTMHDELHRVCVDVALYDRLRKQREDELRDRKRIADAIAMNEEKKRGREERGANLLKFRAATPSTRRITADKEEQERRAQAEAEFKMRAQINRAHVEYGRRNTDAEVGLQKNNARVHATQQVGWLHQHLQRSWARLDHQAEIQRSRMAQERALPGYEHDAMRRHLERSESGHRAESIGSVAAASAAIMSPAVESPVPRPAYMVPQQTGRY